MDDRDKTSSDRVGLLKSWMPWMSEPDHVSRDFWMPDKSCRVCYECDSKFKLFNRRHHCRLCGRIFCSKCTSNWVPTESKSSSENCDRIRVCNYCFKQWEKDLVGPADNGVQVTSLNINNSALSENSYISTKSSETCCSNATFFSMLQSTGLSPLQSPTMKTEIERQSFGATNDHVADKGEENMSQDQFEFYGRNRSYDDDEEFALPRMDSQRSHFSQVNDYYGNAQFDDISSNYTLKDDIGSKIMSRSSVQISFDSPNSKEVEHDIVDEFEASSSVYVAEDVNTEPVDFEDNGILWLPPEPEDKEDEREALLFEDDDDGQGTGEWGYLHKSSSFGSGESRGKDESNEGQKKVMKTVVEAHFRALVAQLLQAENLLSEEENDKESWLEIVIALSWEAATLLKPDTSKGGQMDPGGYVKVKCLASGLRSESSVVKGIVFKKNVAHRRMALKIEKPRLLILGGALEYHRVSNAFSSVDTLLKQETDHLKMAIAKIDAHKPRVLLVEKSVSRYAQDYLLAKDISLVLNIKRPILERIARCTGAQIVPSIDHLSSSKLGYCEMFHVERCSEEHSTLGQAGKRMAKTLMYFEGCPKPLGCTILLRGANEGELKRVKHVIQYGVFAAYHLALETSFLADEGASLSEFPLNPPIAVALLDKAFAIDTYISTIPQSVSEQRSNIVPTSDLINGTTASVEGGEFSETSNLPMSPNNVKPFFMPSIEDFQHSSLNEPSTQHASENQGLVDMPWSSRAKTFETNIPGDLGHSDTNIMQSNNFETDASGCILDPSSLQTDGKQISDEELALKEEFPPPLSDNQSILVSLSSRCVWKGTVCERSQMFRIKYYGNSDKPLGRFLRDHLFDQNYICRSCEMPAEAHVQCYTHRQGTLTISVKKLPEIILPGEKDGKIWMWHRCLRCPRVNGFPPATRRIVMSDAAWGLSFGKFLELSFSNHAAASRVANCGHSLHRDCLRFYGFGKRVACFRYASIDVHSVYLPPSKLDFNYESQEWIERELDEVVGRAEHLFSEVLNALDLLVERKFAKGIAMSGAHFSESKRQISDLEEVLQKEKSELEETFQKILNKDAKKGQPVIDILELNRLRRQLIFQSYIWDHRLIYTASSDVESRPNDIKVTQKPPGETEEISDICDTVNLESNVADAKELEQNPDHVQTDTFPSPVALVSETKSSDESNPLISSVTVRRAFSNGQDPNSLSETLESAWTGESQSESFDVDNVPQSPSVLSSRGSDNVEENVSWLSMSFVSFYRSLNKNFHGPTQKLDTLGEYDPVYISSFRNSELQGGARLLLPVGINDIVIPVYDDEPTSIISYALLSPDYFVQLKDTSSDSVFSMQHIDVGSFYSLDEANLDSSRSLRSGDESMMSLSTSSRSSLPLDPALHARVSFSDDVGKVKYTVTCYYAKHFESLRKICCPSEADFVRSLSRCKKWGAQGGKSNVFFAKTLDDRFIVKQVTKTELESFIKFAPGYFNHLSEAIVTRSPTCLAKTLGIYQVTSKHLKGGKETKMDVLVMENILFGRNVTRLYDLKGSSRSRYNPDSSGSNKVLLDQNLIEAMPTSPIFVGDKAKKMLERAVWNDTAFLASIDVMDYSLLVGVDEEKQELVLGIIDFMRQYTWDKHLETWVKASGILGGPKNASPTVISPLQYKRRFRKAMTTYFLMVPDQWSPPLVVPVKEENEFSEDNSDMGCA